MAKIAYELNLNQENIGARRLQALVEKTFEDISFEAGKNRGKSFDIDAQFVTSKLAKTLKHRDLTRYML